MKHLHFDNESFCERIRKNIKRCRTEQGLTADQLAEKAGLGHDYLRQIESEKDRNHGSLISPYKISMALNISMDALVSENDDK
ncbi:MAG TPA: helix-turn-helix transcriptional regulator [Firmicutes bacterium]|nr:helix-turn-helix transcriptional regulator [Bacillota bacterium]